MYAAFIDFKKAYDTVDRSILLKSLHNNGVQGPLLKNLKAMYENVSYAIKLSNGYLNPIDSNLGLKQGCPLSPYLFIICAEVFSIFINGNPSIKGISLFGDEIKIVQYADDTTLFLDGTYDSLREAVSALDVYQQASGLKINIDKSTVFPLGSLVGNNPFAHPMFGLNWTLGPVTMLGITFDHCTEYTNQ